MLLFRPINQNDLSSVFTLAKEASVGLTTLPADKTILEEKLATATNSFKSDLNTAYYFFALEDLSTNTVAGVSAIDTSIGSEIPFYSYKCSHISRVSNDLDIRNEYKILSLVNDYETKSELCTLFLSSLHRQHGNGLFLSLARLLYIAEFPEKFSDIIFAEMRGVIDEEGHSPFWSGLGEHFFHMSFAEADRLTATTNKQFIADLMPRNSIYIDLLSKQAQDVIAKPHQSTKAAMKILQREGFSWQGYIDIFDGGPTVEANINSIRTITNSQCVDVSEIAATTSTVEYMIANRKSDFKVVRQAIDFISDSKIRLTPEAANALSIDLGDSVRIASFK